MTDILTVTTVDNVTTIAFQTPAWLALWVAYGGLGTALWLRLMRRP